MPAFRLFSSSNCALTLDQASYAWRNQFLNFLYVKNSLATALLSQPKLGERTQGLPPEIAGPTTLAGGPISFLIFLLFKGRVNSLASGAISGRQTEATNPLSSEDRLPEFHAFFGKAIRLTLLMFYGH